jgi:hypothetical protein
VNGMASKIGLKRMNTLMLGILWWRVEWTRTMCGQVFFHLRSQGIHSPLLSGLIQPSSSTHRPLQLSEFTGESTALKWSPVVQWRQNSACVPNLDEHEVHS